MLAVAYPLGDLLLLLGAAATLLRGQPRSSMRSLTVVTTGVGLYVLADLIWSYIILHGTYHGGDRVDTVWIAAAALFSLGAILQPTTGPAESGYITRRVVAPSGLVALFCSVRDVRPACVHPAPRRGFPEPDHHLYRGGRRRGSGSPPATGPAGLPKSRPGARTSLDSFVIRLLTTASREWPTGCCSMNGSTMLWLVGRSPGGTRQC